MIITKTPLSRKVDCSDTVEMYEKMFNDFLDNKV